LESDLLQAQRKQQNLSLLLCDVDHFKLYNDTYGHHAGDECLKKVAQVIGGHSFRPTDLAARYGGEEFGIILPGSDREGASHVAERIRQRIYDLNLPHKSSKSSDRVTVSFGVVSFIPSEDTDVTDYIELADHALYEAKETGRDRVCIHKASD